MRKTILSKLMAASALAIGAAAAVGTVATVRAQVAVKPPDLTFTVGQIPGTIDAAATCAALGAATNTQFVYAYRWGSFGDSGTETANFLDGEGNVLHQNTITIDSRQGPPENFDWSATEPIGAVMVRTGGTLSNGGYNVYTYSPQAMSDVGLFGWEARKIQAVTFCWNPKPGTPGAWCSPGYWRQTHHLDSWVATGISPNEKYSTYFEPVARNRQGVRNNAPADPTLWDVLQYPQYYGGDAFNAVGDLLSSRHPDVNFTGVRVPDSCPLN